MTSASYDTIAAYFDSMKIHSMEPDHTIGRTQPAGDHPNFYLSVWFVVGISLNKNQST